MSWREESRKRHLERFGDSIDFDEFADQAQSKGKLDRLINMHEKASNSKNRRAVVDKIVDLVQEEAES